MYNMISIFLRVQINNLHYQWQDCLFVTTAKKVHIITTARIHTSSLQFVATTINDIWNICNIKYGLEKKGSEREKKATRIIRNVELKTKQKGKCSSKRALKVKSKYIHAHTVYRTPENAKFDAKRVLSRGNKNVHSRRGDRQVDILFLEVEIGLMRDLYKKVNVSVETR